MKNLIDKLGDIMFGERTDRITKTGLICCAVYFAIMIVMGIIS